MLIKHKKWLFVYGTVCFLLIAPFIAIYSLGYELDFEDTSVKNSLSVDISTLPRGANILINNKKIDKTPSNIRTDVGRNVSVELQNSGFHNEKYNIWTPDGDNSSAKFSNIVLLPKKSTTIDRISSDSQYYFLDQFNLLEVRSDEMDIISYDISGFRQKEKVNTDGVAIELNLDKWKKLTNQSWWSKENQVMIYRNDNVYETLNIRDLPFEAVQVIHNLNSSILLLDTEKRLWNIDLNNLEFDFVISGVKSIEQTLKPNNIWVFRDRKLYRFPMNFNLNQVSDIDTSRVFIDFQNYDFDDEFEKLEISSGSLGLYIQVGQKLFFSSDFDPQSVVMISDKTVEFLPIRNYVIYSNTKNKIKSYSFALNNNVFFEDLELEEGEKITEISYYLPWKRLVITTNESVYGSFFDSNLTNKAQVTYQAVKWTEGNRCSDIMIDNALICIKDDKLVMYSNTSIF